MQCNSPSCHMNSFSSSKSYFHSKPIKLFSTKYKLIISCFLLGQIGITRIKETIRLQHVLIRQIPLKSCKTSKSEYLKQQGEYLSWSLDKKKVPNSLLHNDGWVTCIHYISNFSNFKSQIFPWKTSVHFHDHCKLCLLGM